MSVPLIPMPTPMPIWEDRGSEESVEAETVLLTVGEVVPSI